MSNAINVYNSWLENEYFDEATKAELRQISGDQTEIEERFYKDLTFGTAGLRGIMGAGTNRMNIYTVRRASQGMAKYILSKGGDAAEKGIVIAYDSRNMSDRFAWEAAAVFTGNGITTYLFEALRPTPELSFAVRYLKASGGVVITASHNPKEYNGYKAYGDDGAQLSLEDADAVLSEINGISDWMDIKLADIDEAKASGLLRIIADGVDTPYIENAKAQIVNKDIVNKMASQVRIIYTPLHGAGNIPVRRVLKELGFTDVHVVAEQEKPDGNFTTLKSPNPENPSAFELARKYDADIGADLIVGTDPDSDRVGIIVKDSEGKAFVLSGNQTGALLLDYVVQNTMKQEPKPEKPFVISTVVTSRLPQKICAANGVNYVEVLTGFKFIGEQVKNRDEFGDETFLFGFEESYGYLKGTKVRDKDAVIAVTLAAEMTCYYKSKGMTLYDGLIDMYRRYGYYTDTTDNFVLEGIAGAKKIAEAMNVLRDSEMTGFGELTAKITEDYKTGIRKYAQTGKTEEIDMPSSNVLRYTIDEDTWFAIRPSGTEPKIKIYFGVNRETPEESQAASERLRTNVLAAIRPLLDM